MKKKTISRVLGLATVFAIMASLALVRTGRLWGHDFSAYHKALPSTESVTRLPEGRMVVNTTAIGSGITGYAGTVPLKIYITDDRIDSVVTLKNSESPDFFRRVTESGMLEMWNGKSLQGAAAIEPDAVSGATFSSTAIIKNMQAGIAEALKAQGEEMTADRRLADADGWDYRSIAVLIVTLMAAIIPLLTHDKRIRMAQQVLNTAILGFWAGIFIDYSMMIKVASSGLTFSAASISTLLLSIMAFVYPLAGKGTYYCAQVCPFGSLQDLAGHLSKRKLHIRQRILRILNAFREILFSVLIFLLWLGAGAEWIDYEIFTGFIVESAAWSVLATGAAFTVLSVFVPRPFCRFVCPTGTLLRLPAGIVNQFKGLNV